MDHCATGRTGTPLDADANWRYVSPCSSSSSSCSRSSRRFIPRARRRKSPPGSPWRRARSDAAVQRAQPRRHFCARAAQRFLRRRIVGDGVICAISFALDPPSIASVTRFSLTRLTAAALGTARQHAGARADELHQQQRRLGQRARLARARGACVCRVVLRRGPLSRHGRRAIPKDTHLSYDRRFTGLTSTAGSVRSGDVTSAYTPPPPAADVQEPAATRVAIFRWRGIFALMFGFAVLAVVWLIFGKHWIRTTLQDTSSQVMGTEVDIGGLSLDVAKRRWSCEPSPSPIRSTTLATSSKSYARALCSTRTRSSRRRS